MPFGPYTDFEDCLADNQDKEFPDGFCAALHFAITGEWPGAKEAATKGRPYIIEHVAALIETFPEGMDVGLKQVENIIAAFEEWAGTDPGNFTACVDILGGKPEITDAESLCAWLHHEATG